MEQGAASCGYLGRFHIMPSHVSFAAIETQEQIAIGNGHEVDSNTETEVIMDLHNNAVGRGIAASHTHGSDYSCCQAAIQSAIVSGNMWYLDSSHGTEDSTGSAFLQPTNK